VKYNSSGQIDPAGTTMYSNGVADEYKKEVSRATEVGMKAELFEHSLSLSGAYYYTSVDNMQISPGFAYEKAPDQEHWLGPEETRQLFAKAFAGGRRKKWRLNHSPLFLDFLEGKVDFSCTAWAIPSYSLKGWQRPCYLMEDGWVPTYKELIEGTDWDAYGRGKDPRCANCMAHCGYEPSAVLATTNSLRETIRAARGS